MQIATQCLEFVDNHNNQYRVSARKADIKSRRSRVSRQAKRVLVVEDSPILQTVHRISLEAKGYQVDIADCGREALALYDGHYDMILLDIDLPDMSGLEICRKIRQSQPDVPIVFVSSHDADEMQSTCRDAGGNAYFQKPVNYEILDQCLRALMPSPNIASTVYCGVNKRLNSAEKFKNHSVT